MNTEIPVLDAYRDRDGLGLSVWCKHCRRWHGHSLGDGHRVAHCHDRSSPYDDTGYILREVGPWKDRPRYPARRP